ncbi:MAG: terminase large subunit [Hyphomonas sp.]|nr:terminase large subunit [Hyphomonas sp.]
MLTATMPTMQTLPPSTERRFRLVGPSDPQALAFAERIAQKRRLNAVPRLWGYRDERGVLWMFDPYEGERVIRWIEKFCRHRKGEWAGQPIKLAPWQRRIIRQIFGWFGLDGFRKFREAWLEIPRKNGKSTLASCVSAYLTIGDREPAAEVYIIATSQKQAIDLVYADTKAMIEGSPALAAQVETAKKGAYHEASDSRLQTLGKGSQHGYNPHGVIGDEVHEWKGRDQYEAMTTAQGTRRQPLKLFITTAGHDRASLCGELHDIAVQARDGLIYRPDLYVRIFAAGLNDDWKDEATWHKANPGLRYGAPKLSALREAFIKAEQSKAEENSFRRLHLNLWTDSQTAWIRGADWDACRRQIEWEKLAGARCIAGLDLAKVLDLSALALLFTPDNPLFPGKWILGLKFWCPEANIRERAKSDGVNYQAWADAGLLTATPGNATDFDAIERDILALSRIFRIEGLGFDPFLAQQLIQHLIEAGIPCHEVRQGFLTLGPPTAEFERMVIAGEIVHGGHAIMNWNVANVQVDTDAAGNIKPNKAKSKRKIDGVTAAVNATALGLTVELAPNLDGFLSAPVMSAG